MSTRLASWLCHVLCLLVFACIGTLPLQAQSSTSISGCIQDSTNAAIPGATVILTRIDPEQRYRTTTDERGCFNFGVVNSTYKLLILAEAFAPVERELTVDGSLELETATLQIEPIHNTVVVTATRTLVSSTSIGSSVDVIDRQEIEASQLRSTADLLRSVAGLAVVKSGNTGGITSLFTRGGESDYTKVLLDGIPVNQPGGIYDFSHLATDNIARVEVVRGPQSALFGSDAIGGVVQIITRQGSGPPEFEYSAEAGSFGATEQRAGLRGGWNKFDYSSTFSRQDSDNIGRNNDYRNASWFGNFGFTPDARQSLRATMVHGSVKAGAPGATAAGFTSFGPNNRMSRLERAGGLTYRALVGSRVTQHAAYRLYDHDQYFYSAFGVSTVLHTRHRLEYHGDVVFPVAGTLSYGVDYDRENATVATKRHDRDNAGYYAQQQISIGRFDLTAGLRMEDNTTFGTKANPRVSASFRLSPATRVRFNAGTGIKEPNFIENFSESSFFLGNPDLLAEESRSWEAGVEQSFWEDRIVGDAAWFDNRIRNVIQLVRQPNGVSRYENIGRQFARGIEVRVRSRVRQVSAQANYTYLEGQIQESTQTSFPYRVGDPLLRRPAHSGDFSLMWAAPWWTAHWSTRIVGERADSDFFTHSTPLFTNERYTSSDFAFTANLGRHFSPFVRIENLFGRSYQEVLGYQALGRSIVAGSRVRIGAAR